MILVDTSIWVDHFRAPETMLDELLARREVLLHPFVLGELALGGHTQQREVLEALADLPQAPVAEAEEVIALIGRLGLAGSGIGYVDAHLIGGALLPNKRWVRRISIWTRDRKLDAAAQRAGVSVHQHLH